jgi:hypothetical protein
MAKTRNRWKRLYAALDKANAILVRQDKHEIWRLPNGQQLAIATTSTSNRGELNAISELRRRLSIVPEKFYAQNM